MTLQTPCPQDPSCSHPTLHPPKPLAKALAQMAQEET